LGIGNESTAFLALEFFTNDLALLRKPTNDLPLSSPSSFLYDKISF
jgi:hypothetical protein